MPLSKASAVGLSLFERVFLPLAGLVRLKSRGLPDIISNHVDLKNKILR
ncbi:MAG: hypothetical protein SCAL_000472 [Candidatus Syntrophoarchaeum caldarius]|uniref:Uncharacterized protein n=1 Tax=Candidatus Syntropharchaeum caldarium TaxID=1838285 RepID=A0A1F2PDS1_9EURY|nr:MAG: hypothetical protein SCAL_000472 [Candidatus Syntrophoarchaeum caldarius]